MKKIILGLMSLVFVFGMFGLVSQAQAAKSTSTCNTIQGGLIKDIANNVIKLGYDKWGYNYQARSFNGWYDNYSRPDSVATSGDVLQMKWNDAWLSNKDCATQGADQGAFIPGKDGKLDRHYPSASYIGSGAWLTNHASGTYDGAPTDNWDTTGIYIFRFNLGGDYDHDLFLTDTVGVLSGNGGYPSGGPYSFAWTITSGNVFGNVVDFYADYTVGAVGTTMHVVGTIAPDGTMSGTWSDNYGGGLREGTWTSTFGAASGQVCTWTDFIKIVAAPSGATVDGGNWVLNGTIIGPVLWGSFAIIQEVSANPCGQDLGLLNYQSELRSGLGNW